MYRAGLTADIIPDFTSEFPTEFTAPQLLSDVEFPSLNVPGYRILFSTGNSYLVLIQYSTTTKGTIQISYLTSLYYITIMHCTVYAQFMHSVCCALLYPNATGLNNIYLKLSGKGKMRDTEPNHKI